MRFTALLLLAALAGALFCAQETTADSTQAAVAEDTLSPELHTTAPTKSTSLQDTTTVPQKPSVAAEQPARVTLWRPGQHPLNSMIEKGLTLAGKVVEGAERRMKEVIPDGKVLVENGVDFLQRLKNRLYPITVWL